MLTNAFTMRAKELDRMRSPIVFAHRALCIWHIEKYEQLRAECDSLRQQRGKLLEDLRNSQKQIGTTPVHDYSDKAPLIRILVRLPSIPLDACLDASLITVCQTGCRRRCRWSAQRLRRAWISSA